MKRKTKKINDGYEDGPDDLNWKDYIPAHDPRLPSPQEVAEMLKNARITIILDDQTVSFFKREAKNNEVKYQAMIREVLRNYARQHSSRGRSSVARKPPA